MELNDYEKEIFCTVAGTTNGDEFEIPAGAYNFRVNGKSVGRNSTKNIDVKPKTDKSGLDITIKPGTKNEQVHIPVAISATGIKEAVLMLSAMITPSLDISPELVSTLVLRLTAGESKLPVIVAV